MEIFAYILMKTVLLACKNVKLLEHPTKSQGNSVQL